MSADETTKPRHKAAKMGTPNDIHHQHEPEDRMGDWKHHLDTLDHEVGDLTKTVTTLETVQNQHGRVLSDVSHKTDEILSKIAATSGTEGRVPVQNVTWAIGAFISLVGVGLAIIMGFDKRIGDDINHNAEISKIRYDSNMDALRTVVDHSKERMRDAEHEILAIKAGQSETSSTRFRKSDQDAFLTNQWGPLIKEHIELQRQTAEFSAEIEFLKTILFESGIDTTKNNPEP